jgi:hypothetical protein
VIPLPYIQKRKQHATAPIKTEEVPVPVTFSDTPKTASPLVAETPPTANGNVDVTEQTEVEAEPAPVTPAVQEVEDSADATVAEVQEASVKAFPPGEK